MWITLSKSDLANRLSETELRRVSEAKLADGQTGDGVIAEVIADVVRVVRGYAAKRNSLGPDGTIPDETKDAALAIVRMRVFTRLPDLDLLGEDRRAEARDANTLLRSLAAGVLVIEQAAESSGEQSGGVDFDVVTKTDRVATRERLSGL